MKCRINRKTKGAALIAATLLGGALLGPLPAEAGFGSFFKKTFFRPGHNFKKAANVVADVAKDAGSGLSTAFNVTVDGIVDAGNTVGDGVVDVGNKIGDGVVHAANTVGDGVKDAAGKVADGVNTAINAVKDVVDDGIDGGKLAVDTIKMVKTAIQDIIKIVKAGKSGDVTRALAAANDMLETIEKSKLVSDKIRENAKLKLGFDVVTDALKVYPVMAPKIVAMEKATGGKKPREIIEALENILDVFSKTELAKLLADKAGAGKSFPDQLMDTLRDLHKLADGLETGGKIMDSAIKAKNTTDVAHAAGQMVKTIAASHLVKTGFAQATKHSKALGSVASMGKAFLSGLK